MKALVTTINHLLLVDLSLRTVNVIESNRTEYYGISWWENNPTLVLSHSGLNNDTTLDIDSYMHSEKGYLSFDQLQTPDFFTASLNYSFPHSDELPEQHISLVVGYRGGGDTNMLAILINSVTRKKLVTLHLWANKNGV